MHKSHKQPADKSREMATAKSNEIYKNSSKIFIFLNKSLWRQLHLHFKLLNWMWKKVKNFNSTIQTNHTHHIHSDKYKIQLETKLKYKKTNLQVPKLKVVPNI